MEAELSLHDYWRIIKKRQWGGLMVFTATFLSTAFYTRLQTPLYRASASVSFQPPSSKLMGQGTVDVSSVMQNELRMLDSPEMYARVAKKMGIPQDKIP